MWMLCCSVLTFLQLFDLYSLSAKKLLGLYLSRYLAVASVLRVHYVPTEEMQKLEIHL